MKVFKKLSAMMLAGTLVVTSMAGFGAPTDVYGASASVTVSTQKQLDKALKDSKIAKIVVKSSAKKTLTIKKGKFDKKTLILKGAKLTISNQGKFKNIEVKDVSKYTEKASDNTILVTDSKETMVVDKASKVKSLTFAKKGAVNKFTVNGKISKLDVTEKCSIELKGNTVSTLTVNIKKNVEVKVINKTNKSIKVKDFEGTVLKVKPGTTIKSEVKKPDTPVDTDKTDEPVSDDKKEDTTQKDKTPSDDKNNSNNSSYSGGSSDSSGSSAISGSDFASMIANAEESEGKYEVTLTKNVSGDVNAIFNKPGTLVIKLENHIIYGNLSISANDATKIQILDLGEGAQGATITGKLVIDAPKAHVVNFATVNGAVELIHVAPNTFVLNDSVARVDALGSGKIEFANNLKTVPDVNIKTTEPVALASGVKKVTVQVESAQIELVDENSSISEIVVPKESGNLTLSGAGKLDKLDASAPVTLNVNVESVVVNSSDAEITVESGKKIDSIVVGAEVTSVKLEGEGTVGTIDMSAVDVSKLEEIQVPSGATIVADANQASALQEKCPEATVKAVTEISVEGDASIKLPVGTELDLSEYKLSVSYTTGTPEYISVNSAMLVNNYVRTTPGTSEVKVKYASKEVTLTTITYCGQDVITYTCPGVHSVEVNGDNNAYHMYTMGTQYLADGLDKVIRFNSAYGLPIKIQYAPLKEGGNRTDGFPTQPGNYLIVASTSDTENVYGTEVCIWISATPDNDFIVFDTEAFVNKAKELYIACGCESAENFTEGRIWGWISFPATAVYSKDAVQAMFDASIRSNNGGKISYDYFYEGTNRGTYNPGLPEKAGNYCINVTSLDAYGHTARARFVVKCEGLTPMSAQFTVSGNGVKAQNVDSEAGIKIVCEGNTVDAIWSKGYIDLTYQIDIPYGTDYTILLNTSSIEMYNFQVDKITKFEYDAQGRICGCQVTGCEDGKLPTAPGTYYISVVIEGDGTTTATACYRQVINIK